MIRVVVGACVIAALTTVAAAEPRPPALAWQAPDACPGAADARARVEKRLGEPMERFVVGITVAIDSDPRGYVAHVGERTLTSDTCDDLTDAVALVVARIATEAPRRDAPSGPARWGGGVRGSWMSGIGGVPSVGIGGELAAYVRHDRLLVELGAADWARTSHISPGAPSAIDVGLQTATLRVGYAPEPKAIRGWVALDVGAMSGGGEGVVGPNAGRAAWVAIGPGFAVAWPIAPRFRLVGTIEVLASVTHSRFVLADGMTLYEPSPVSARTTLGLEVGWR